MPLAKIVHKINLKYRELQTRLVEEWSSPQQGAAEPVIIEEADTQGRVPTHLYVIWNAWSDLDQIERSEIIMEACEQVRGRDFALNVTVAMGLTTREAERMGIEYAPLDTAA